MSAYDHFPTEFAIQIARSAELYPKKSVHDYTGGKKRRMIRFAALLSEFQQISVLFGYEKAIGLYSNEKLNKEQYEALEKIAEFAPIQASGIAVESMIKIVKDNPAHRDYSRIVELLMENINNKEGEFIDEKKMNKLVNDLLK